MRDKIKYRHEMKYELTPLQKIELQSRVKSVMTLDKNNQEHGSYKVQSIYFDNLYNKAVNEKVSGLSKREKFRIRFYNNNLDYIVLEKKMKRNNLCMKVSARITKEECMSILDGDISFMAYHKEPLVKELYTKMKCELLRPKSYVTYDRTAYIFKAGNVRVTFDSNIKTSLSYKNCFESDLLEISVQDSQATTILEVKYDEFLPDVIATIVQIDGIRQQAFSKYVAARSLG